MDPRQINTPLNFVGQPATFTGGPSVIPTAVTTTVTIAETANAACCGSAPMATAPFISAPISAPTPSALPNVNLAPKENPDLKAKAFAPIMPSGASASKPVPAPLPAVAPAAVPFAPAAVPFAPVATGPIDTPLRYHNTTAHVADVAHDPRPLLPVDNEVHDFEVHREGNYAKGHTRPHGNKHAAAAATGLATGAPIAAAGPGLVSNTAPFAGGANYPAGHAVGPGTGGARPHVFREGLVGNTVAGAAPGAVVVNDPRPVLPLEREVHDFEVHRQGGHAAGHTRPGAKPDGTFVGAVPAAVKVHGNTTDVIAMPGAGAVPASGFTGKHPTTTL